MWLKEEEGEGVVGGEAEEGLGVEAVVVAPLEAEVVVVEVGEVTREVAVVVAEGEAVVEVEGACELKLLG